MLQGYPPEMFPAGYDEYIMGLMVHPEVLGIHEQMIDEVRFGALLLLLPTHFLHAHG